MSQKSFVIALLFLSALAASLARADENAADPTKIEFFEKKIRPILAANCFNCHSADTNSKGGLRVDDRNGLLTGGGRGAAIVPGQPDQSWLIKAVRHTNPKLKMPPEQALSDEEIADLTKWVADGAAWPAIRIPTSLGQPNEEYEKLRAEHWAWQPLTKPAVPTPEDANWARDDVDRFVLAALDAAHLHPVGDANRLDLIRRVTFDLTGLPPTPDEATAFVNDTSPTAFENVVDRLLASTAFGERWGRHWLDIARYGESTGPSRNLPYPHAWRYRDYVIRSFNADKPYDQFVREQIAGDLLPANSPREKAEQLVATGFLALGVKDVNQRFKVRYIMDKVDEQIDTVTRSILGLTVSCARCHDHKFDPIPTTDYYALAGIFRSTDICDGLRNKMGGGGLDYYDTHMLIHIGLGESTVASPEKLAAAKAAFEKARAEFQALQNSPEGAEKAPNGKPKRMNARQKMNRLQNELTALSDPASGGEVAYGVRDSANVADTEVRIRGEAEKLGPVVSRGYLGVLHVAGQLPINPRQSGRLELADWLTNPENPLASRVIVNRVWQHLFGTGLVRSVDNFGVTGDAPSHPELLDHLAQRFIQNKWSIKKLVRALVLTHAYQLSSEASEANLAVDPANRLVWRHSPRRLDAEEIRDTLLAVTGKLDKTPPTASPAKDFRVVELRNNGPEARQLEALGNTSVNRSVYLPLLRGLTPRSLEVFDFAEQGFVTGSRDTTTVATQALYLLNDNFVRQSGVDLASRLLAEPSVDDAARIDLAYRLAFGRSPTPSDVERALAYLRDFETSAQELVSSASAEKSEGVPADSTAESSSTEGATGGAVKKPEPAVPANPDDPVPGIEPAAEEFRDPQDPKVLAWATFCQALFGAAEFRYLK